mmetsp:Transcript_13226/g.17282  ORF Transcript_13226/g.17282 Transcript_13226/m.17282 type:complete len:405 (-) Transcript_13226:106-1320(-)
MPKLVPGQVTPIDALFVTVMGLVDFSIEAFLQTVVAPFLVLHERFYFQLNLHLREGLEKLYAQGFLMEWFTANFVTYGRTLLVIPTLYLISLNCGFANVLSSMLVILVDFGDFLDGVLARFWNDHQKDSKGGDVEKDMIEPSWRVTTHSSTYGGFVDAVCDKAFVVPVWILLLSTVSQNENAHLIFAKYTVLFSLILLESCSAVIRFRAYFMSVGVKAPKLQGSYLENLFTSSAVKADHVGKAKQTFEMVGTALLILNGRIMSMFALILLAMAVPLSYESIKRKLNNRVIYVDGGTAKLDHGILKFWMQSKTLGSKLVVGVLGDSSSLSAKNAKAVNCVDGVITEISGKVDLIFLEKYDIDFVACMPALHMFADDSVLKAGKCIMIADDGTAKLIGRLDDKKKD